MRIPTIADDGHLPRYARPGDAGADLVAAEDVALEPGERRLVGTGVRVAIPEGHVGLVTPRSTEIDWSDGFDEDDLAA